MICLYSKFFSQMIFPSVHPQAAAASSMHHYLLNIDCLVERASWNHGTKLEIILNHHHIFSKLQKHIRHKFAKIVHIALILTLHPSWQSVCSSFPKKSQVLNDDSISISLLIVKHVLCQKKNSTHTCLLILCIVPDCYFCDPDLASMLPMDLLRLPNKKKFRYSTPFPISGT